VPALGLGSWDLDILYDDTVVTATACTAGTGGCSIATLGKVDILGFVGTPLTGVQTLGTITFSAVGTEGQSSPVTITVVDFNDGNGDPTSPATTNGTTTIQTSSLTPTLTLTPTPAPTHPPTPTPVDTASGTVGPGGGTVDTGSGDPVEASVTIPAGALSSDQEITIEEIDSEGLPDPPPGQTLLARAFNLKPDGLTFSGPVTITFTYTDAEVAGLDESSLTVGLLEGGSWQIVPDCDDPSVPTPSPCVESSDAAANTITVVTDHSSTYGILAPTPASPPTFSGPELTDPPNNGGSPADDPSGSPYLWLAAVLGGLILAAGGLTALRVRRRSR